MVGNPARIKGVVEIGELGFSVLPMSIEVS